MTDEQVTTNERIAELLLEQTYEERMEMASWLADVISDWPANGAETDADSVAVLLQTWANDTMPDAPEEQ